MCIEPPIYRSERALEILKQACEFYRKNLELARTEIPIQGTGEEPKQGFGLLGPTVLAEREYEVIKTISDILKPLNNQPGTEAVNITAAAVALYYCYIDIYQIRDQMKILVAAYAPNFVFLGVSKKEEDTSEKLDVSTAEDSTKIVSAKPKTKKRQVESRKIRT